MHDNQDLAGVFVRMHALCGVSTNAKSGGARRTRLTGAWPQAQRDGASSSHTRAQGVLEAAWATNYLETWAVIGIHCTKTGRPAYTKDHPTPNQAETYVKGITESNRKG